MLSHRMDFGLGEDIDAMGDIVHHFAQIKIAPDTSTILRMLIGCKIFAETA